MAASHSDGSNCDAIVVVVVVVVAAAAANDGDSNYKSGAPRGPHPKHGRGEFKISARGYKTDDLPLDPSADLMARQKCRQLASLWPTKASSSLMEVLTKSLLCSNASQLLIVGGPFGATMMALDKFDSSIPLLEPNCRSGRWGGYRGGVGRIEVSMTSSSNALLPYPPAGAGARAGAGLT